MSNARWALTKAEREQAERQRQVALINHSLDLANRYRYYGLYTLDRGSGMRIFHPDIRCLAKVGM